MKSFVTFVVAAILSLGVASAARAQALPSGYSVYVANSSSVVVKTFANISSYTCNLAPVAAPTFPLPGLPLKLYWDDPSNAGKQCAYTLITLNTLSPDTYTVTISALLGSFETAKVASGSFVQPNPNPPTNSFIK